jgi:hypothetical protein
LKRLKKRDALARREGFWGAGEGGGGGGGDGRDGIGGGGSRWRLIGCERRGRPQRGGCCGVSCGGATRTMLMGMTLAYWISAVYEASEEGDEDDKDAQLKRLSSGCRSSSPLCAPAFFLIVVNCGVKEGQWRRCGVI